MARRGRPRGFDRDEALRVATELFWRRGYDSTSLSELTGAIGISPSSFYETFGSKQELFYEVVQLYAAPERAPIHRAVREQPTARQVVEALLRDCVDAYTNPKTPVGCLVVLGAVNCANADVQEHLADLRRGDLRRVEQRLERAVSDGDLPSGTDTAVLAAFVLTLHQGLCLQARDGQSRQALQAVVDRSMLAWDAVAGA
jgi:AcrR family transcriptional regulator